MGREGNVRQFDLHTKREGGAKAIEKGCWRTKNLNRMSTFGDEMRCNTDSHMNEVKFEMEKWGACKSNPEDRIYYTSNPNRKSGLVRKTRSDHSRILPDRIDRPV